jgi:hypothetical protein
MKPKVVVSLEAAKGDRCVNILRHNESMYSFRECSRDPDLGQGWRYQADAQPEVFATYSKALHAVRNTVTWLRT